MDVTSIDVQLVADLLLLLLIEIGPKIALVPFLEVTNGLDALTGAMVIRLLTLGAIGSGTGARLHTVESR